MVDPSTIVQSVADSLGDHLTDFYHNNETTTMGAYEVIRPAANVKHGLTHSQSNLSIGYTVIPGQPMLSLSSFAHKSAEIMDEFLKSDDSATAAAAVDALKKLDCALYHDLLIARSILKVLPESEDMQSRLASFLTVLYDAKLITRPQVTRAFEKLIQSAETLHKDVRDVEDKLFSFFSVAVEDALVDFEYLTRLPEALVKNLTPAITDNEPYVKPYLEKLQRYKQRCVDFMPEFFNSGESQAVQDFLKDVEAELFVKEKEVERPVDSAAVFPPLTRDTLRHELVRRLVATSLGQQNIHREMVSRCLSELYVAGPYTFSPDDIQLGVLRLLAGVQDLTLDVPLASDMISSFIVRMNVDDILPPAFVSDFLRLNLGDSLGVVTLRRAFRWMTDSAKHHLLSERFTKVWTGTEGYRPEVEEFKRELKDLIYDYYNTADVSTALTLFNALDMSPDQEVEAIRKVVQYALDRQKDAWALSVAFLMTLRDEKEVDAEAILKGFNQIRDRLPDISIDCPSAHENLESYFIPECKALALLPGEWVL